MKLKEQNGQRSGCYNEVQDRVACRIVVVVKYHHHYL